jgi:hypothetical protein
VSLRLLESDNQSLASQILLLDLDEDLEDDGLTDMDDLTTPVPTVLSA